MPESPSSQPFTSEGTLWSLIASRIASATTRLATNKRKAKSKNRAANQSMEIEWGADLEKLANLNISEVTVTQDELAIGVQPWQFLDFVIGGKKRSHYFIMHNLKNSTLTIDKDNQKAHLTLTEGSPTAKDMEWVGHLMVRSHSIAECILSRQGNLDDSPARYSWEQRRHLTHKVEEAQQDDCPIGDLSWMKGHPELSELRWLK